MSASSLIDRVLLDQPLQQLEAAISEYRGAEAPLTWSLLTVVSCVFAFQVMLTILSDAQSINVVATGLFAGAPLVAWPLSPLLHGGILHVAANVGGVFVFGVPIEADLPEDRYVHLVVIAAVCSTVAGSLLMLASTSGPIAVYGLSGVLYAFAGFAVLQYGTGTPIEGPSEKVAFLGGIAAAITVVKDVLLGIVTGSSINGGHTAGLLIGLTLAWWWRTYHQ
jgi:membrane associated rhomboid family serine protease